MGGGTHGTRRCAAPKRIPVAQTPTANRAADSFPRKRYSFQAASYHIQASLALLVGGLGGRAQEA